MNPSGKTSTTRHKINVLTTKDQLSLVANILAEKEVATLIASNEIPTPVPVAIARNILESATGRIGIFDRCFFRPDLQGNFVIAPEKFFEHSLVIQGFLMCRELYNARLWLEYPRFQEWSKKEVVKAYEAWTPEKDVSKNGQFISLGQLQDFFMTPLNTILTVWTVKKYASFSRYIPLGIEGKMDSLWESCEKRKISLIHFVLCATQHLHLAAKLTINTRLGRYSGYTTEQIRNFLNYIHEKCEKVIPNWHNHGSFWLERLVWQCSDPFEFLHEGYMLCYILKYAPRPHD